MSTFVARFLDALARDPDGRAVTFLADGETEERTLTRGELDRAARSLAARLAGHITRGDRVLIMCEPGLEYVAGFLGCIYAGAIAVPAYPPSAMALERSADRLRAVVADSGARCAVTSRIFDDPGIRRLVDENLTWLTIDASGHLTSALPEPARGEPGDVIFLQYTSGSTSAPKGLLITNERLLANLDMVATSYDLRPGAPMVSWLPPYHDMGLIGGMLSPLLLGSHLVLMSPEAFVKRPVRWLRAIDRYQGFVSPAPNFAFELCTRRVTDEEISTLDLSSWRVAINGAEPVDGPTVQRFIDRFARCGFAASALRPAYGLAEATLLAATGSIGLTAHIIDVDAEALEQGRVVAATVGTTRTLVTCGTPPSGSRITVVSRDDGRTPLPDGEIGELVITGPHVTTGYWGTTETANFAETATGEWEFHSGDLGAFIDGELVVTGRIKDLLIVRGRNHYPQDIERSIERAAPAVRPGCSVAIGIADPNGNDQLVIVCEVRDTVSADGWRETIGAIRATITEEHGIRAAAVVLIEPRSLPKTSSGKVQRAPTRLALEHGRLAIVHEWQAAGGTPIG